MHKTATAKRLDQVRDPLSGHKMRGYACLLHGSALQTGTCKGHTRIRQRSKNLGCLQSPTGIAPPLSQLLTSKGKVHAQLPRQPRQEEGAPNIREEPCKCQPGPSHTPQAHAVREEQQPWRYR
jgi:hypothetical protein